MILLPVAHRVLTDTLKDRIFPPSPLRLDEKVADFDGVTYHISTPNSKSVIMISMNCPCFDELLKYGARQILEREYGALLMATPEPGYNVSLQVDLDRLPTSTQEQEMMIEKIGLLKRNAMAAPFYVAFDAQSQGHETPTMAVHYRDEEAFYVKAMEDRVTVIFSTKFSQETDRMIGKVFLQEFVDARRQPSIQNAPQVLYSKDEAPLELKDINQGVGASSDVGYITFVLFPRHFSTGQAREECISKIQMFRDYFHYHIKCCKSHMHSRMRLKVDSFLKVLNRAKPEKPVEKKTISGKTFKRN